MNNSVLKYNLINSRTELINKILAFLLIFLMVIPVGIIPGMVVAPINYLFVLIFVRIFFSLRIIMQKIDRGIIIILFSFLLYFILSRYLIYMKEGYYIEIAKTYRFFLSVLFFLLINEKKTLYFLLKSFTYFILFSSVFGILIYSFGEPFASIRMLILDPSVIGKIVHFGQGDRVVGFYNKLFHFAYLISVLPTLLLMFYSIEKKQKYIIYIVISFVCIVLNGERAALLFSILPFLFFYNKIYGLKKGAIILCSISLFFYLLLSFTFNLNSILFSEVFILRIEDEFLNRLLRQFAGISSVFTSPFIGSLQDNYFDIYKNWMGFIPRSAHNAYVNIGIKAGILGWFLFILFSSKLVKYIGNFKNNYNNNIKEKIVYYGTISAFLSPLLVALTHNAGIFDLEPTSNIIFFLIISFSRVKL